MNRVGPSTATAPMAATWPGLPSANRLCDAATTMVSTNAAASAPSAERAGARRGAAGAARTPRPARPTMAAPKTSSIGASWPYSMLRRGDGDRGSVASDPRRHGAAPFCAVLVSGVRRAPGCGMDGASVGWCGTGRSMRLHVRTAGLMMSSSGLRVEAEHDDAARSAADRPQLPGHAGRACPATSSRTGPVIVRWYIHRM